MSRPWDPFGGGSQKPWDGDAFGGSRSPYGAARPAQDPWAGAPDPWGAAPQPYQVPAAASAAPAPARGDTGRYRVLSGLRRPSAAPVYGTGYQQGYAQGPGYGAPFSGYAAPAAPVAPAAPPQAVPQTQWGVYQSVDPFGSPLAPAATAAPIPPKARPIIPIVLGAAAIVVALIVVAGAVVVVAKKGTTSTASGPITTASASATATTPVTTTSYPTSTTRRTTRTSTSTTKPTPTGTAALQNNPLYSDPTAGLARQACNPVGWPQNADAAKPFFDSLVPCLDTAWKPLVTTAGLAYRTPLVLVPTGTLIVNPCRTQDMSTGHVAAFYCPANQTLYMPVAGFYTDILGDHPLSYASIFAHEFGHHIQHLSGIGDAEWAQRLAMGVESAAGLESSRRIELQAQCFSGMFIGSIVDAGGMFTQADFDETYSHENRTEGVVRDHGTPQHQQGWWRQGGDTDQIGQCNTWLAPPSDVS